MKKCWFDWKHNMDHDKIAKKEIIKCGVKDFHFKKLAFSIYILRKIKKLF